MNFAPVFIHDQLVGIWTCGHTMYLPSRWPSTGFGRKTLSQYVNMMHMSRSPVFVCVCGGGGVGGRHGLRADTIRTKGPDSICAERIVLFTVRHVQKIRTILFHYSNFKFMQAMTKCLARCSDWHGKMLFETSLVSNVFPRNSLSVHNGKWSDTWARVNILLVDIACKHPNL